jgi:hypothetical protein
MTWSLVAGTAAVSVGLLVVTAFQVALALGAPWGRASYGGQEPRLPGRLRIASAVAAVVWPLLLLIVLRRAGAVGWAPVPDAWLAAATWAVAALLLVGVVANAISRSRVERAVWVPVTLVALAGTVVVAIGGRAG